MLKDALATFATAQAPTATGDTASTDVLDQLVKSGAVGREPWAIARIDTTATSGGAATLAAVLQDSADNSAWADLVVGPAIAVASLTAGKEILKVRVPIGTRRYLRFAWRIGTAVLTAGKFDAFLVDNPQVNLKDVA